MGTIIVYGTKYGCTEKIAKLIEEKITGQVELCNLKGKSKIELKKYDNIIIGGSIYMGRIRKKVSRFCDENLKLINDKKIGLFISCMTEGEEAGKELRENFPKEIYEKAAAKGVFGGIFDFDKLNFMEKLIVKKVVGVKESQSNIFEENIDKFVSEMDLSK